MVEPDPCQPPTDVAGLLLAAGRGRRMGGPKGLLRLESGSPTLVELAVARLRAGGCARVLCVVGAAAERVAPLAESAGADVVVAPDWAEGMGASLRVGLARVARLTPPYVAALVTLVDLPDVSEAVVSRVLRDAAPAPGRLARAAYRGRPGHPVLLGSDHWPAAAAGATGDRGARDMLRGPDIRLIECGDLATGRDLDRPEDLTVRG